MIPLLSSKDLQVRERSAQIILIILKKISKVSPKEILTAWTQIVDLNRETATAFTMKLLEAFPYSKVEKLHASMIHTLVPFVLATDSAVRRTVYQVLEEIYACSSIKGKAVIQSIFITCLGDYHK